MKSRSKLGLVLAAIYAVLFLILFAKATFWPHFDGAEWFAMYFLSFPVSAGIEALRDIGYFFDEETARVLTYAIGSVLFWYAAGTVIDQIFREREKCEKGRS
jgi:hypothetical protein